MKLSSLFSEFSIPTNERELHFLKMMWKILALSLFNVLYLNHYSMHVSDLTGNPGNLSLVKRYWGFKSYTQFVPLKNVWGKLMHVHALGGFDVPKILWIRLLLVSIWSPRVVLSGKCWENCMLEMMELKNQSWCNIL